MLKHLNSFDDGYPERPERISEINRRFGEYCLTDRMRKLPSRHATTGELGLSHSHQHIAHIRKVVAEKGTDELREIADKFNSVYLHESTFECATLAAGSVLQVVDEVLNGDSRCGVCVVRPPGHHAEADVPHGFCVFNNVAVAASYAKQHHGLKRILIVDWDIHHGNGIQHIFERDPNVLYISLHRYDYGAFFPTSEDGNYTVVGEGPGEGFNVNIPWNKRTMGDTEYIAAFQHIIMPIAYEFNPELVLVAAGFDAAIGDPLGGYKVNPEAFGYFTHWLSALANGKLIVCLEGGYNVNSIAYSMTMCAKTLLGDPLPSLQPMHKNGINSSAIETIQNVISVHSKFWKSLKFNKRLPDLDGGRRSAEKERKSMEIAFGSLAVSSPDEASGEGGSPQSSSSDGGGNDSKPKNLENDDFTQPGPSKPTEKIQKLSDYLSDNLQVDTLVLIKIKRCWLLTYH